jgi:hypothetical protein
LPSSLPADLPFSSSFSLSAQASKTWARKRHAHSPSLFPMTSPCPGAHRGPCFPLCPSKQMTG